jgi:FKBP-type peptidyl-prolyl cis-trans isomerase
MKLISCVFAVALLASGCGDDDGGGSSVIPTAPSTNVSFSTTDLRAGSGATATVGRSVDVRYTLWIYSASGTDNKGAQVQTGSFNFTVGTGVIAGFSQGVTGMQVGGIRRVVIPPNLGYGNNPPPANPGEPQIRVNETLIFEIELLAIR